MNTRESKTNSLIIRRTRKRRTLKNEFSRKSTYFLLFKRTIEEHSTSNTHVLKTNSPIVEEQRKEGHLKMNFLEKLPLLL